MKNMEEMLKQNQFNNINVPYDLETRLRNALDKKKIKRKSPFGLIAAAVIFLMVFTYNYDAIAYYTNRILGFDNVVSGTLRDLNNIGKGQIINKGFTTDNGVTVVLDGVIVDSNQLIAFFTVTREGQEVDFYDFNLASLNLNGLMRRYMGQRGISQFNDDKTEIKHVFKFDPPSPFERNLTFSYYYVSNETTNVEKIEFRLDRKKSMGFILTDKINKTIELDSSGKIHFDTIRVSPTQTIIEGTMEVFYNVPTPMELPSPLMINLPQLKIELLADGNAIDLDGNAINLEGDGSFTFWFDTVPAETKKLEIKIVGMTERIDINREIEIQPGENEIKKDALNLPGNNRITIKDFIVKGETSTINILTEEKHPIIEMAYLVSQDERLPLVHIGGGDLYSRDQDQIEILWTLNFNGNISYGPYILEIQTISFLKPHNKSITLQIQ